VSTRRALRRSIEGFSETLGPTATAVAGTPKDSTQCALARCLWAIVGTEGSVTKVAVTERNIHVKRSPGHLPVIVRLPKPVRTFIRAFDNGCYPELVGTGGHQTVVAVPNRSPDSATPGERPEIPIEDTVKPL